MPLAELLIAALGGPAGIVAGWFLNERSSGQRWERERQASDASWRREHVMAAAQQVVSGLNDVHSLTLLAHLAASGGAIPEDARRELHEAWRRADAAIVSLTLLAASAHVRMVALECGPIAFDLAHATDAEQVEGLPDDLSKKLLSLMTAVRRELGLSGDVEPEPE